LYLARRRLQLSPDEWAELSWAMQRTYIEGFYSEELLERPDESPMDADMTVPDDIRSLTASGTAYRAVEAAPFDLAGMISEMEGRR
jgi:hypothetical protein